MGVLALRVVDLAGVLSLGLPRLLLLAAARTRAAATEENLAERVALALGLATLGHETTSFEGCVTIKLSQTKTGRSPD